MAAMEPLCHLLCEDISKFSKSEILIIEADLFVRVYEEVREKFRLQYNEYFKLLNFNLEMENKMLDAMFMKLIIVDILESKEYDLEGMANYMDTHEDILYEVINGRISNPSVNLLRRSIDLHRSVRRELYHGIMKKIVQEVGSEVLNLATG